MQISQDHINRHSEEDFASNLQTLADSGAGVIHIRTQEVVRASLAARKAILMSGNVYKEWNVAQGFVNYDVANMYSLNVSGDGNIDIGTAMGTPGVARTNTETEEDSAYTYYVFINPQYWLEINPVINHHLQQYGHILPPSNIRVLLITPDIPMPEILSDVVVTLPFDPPSHGELGEYLEGIVDSVDEGVVELDESEKDKICYAGAGMSKENFEMYVSLAIVRTASSDDEEKDTETVTVKDLIEGVNDGKTEIVNKNDILELYPAGRMDEVGGMENLKEWVNKRKECYSDAAKEMGIEPPKGMVFVGVPGTGKSLAAKAISNVLGVPLVRLDFGRVFNSLVGQSEHRMRTALKMVESMAPCVLFCDEIDKGLGGIGSGGGDAGTSSRVLGSFLTWLQENKTPVFTMVTANNIDALPPELMRRGRFDAIFSTGMPMGNERLEVLNIHLDKRGWKSGKFTAKEKQKVVTASLGYVPAEIEAAVKDGLVDAFSAGDTFEMSHVVAALGNMVPLSKTYATKIQAMTLWAKNNATPASRAYAPTAENVSSLGGKRARVRKGKGKEHTTLDS